MSLCSKVLAKTCQQQCRSRSILFLNPRQINRFQCAFNNTYNSSTVRCFSESNSEDDVIVYEGPFASLALRLKRISISTAALSVVGIPLLLVYGSSVPASGQIAVGGTAILAATGSTAALSFCFSPYITKLEWVPNNSGDSENEEKGSESRSQKMLLKATTRNFFAMPVETIFDPDVDCIHDPKTYRPFCNFMANGMPFFVHPHLIQNEDLRIKLLGEAKGFLLEDSKQDVDKKKKDPDDEFL